jgi:hypothetical protein
MHKRLQPHAQEAATHAPEAAAPCTRGCNPVHSSRGPISPGARTAASTGPTRPCGPATTTTPTASTYCCTRRRCPSPLSPAPCPSLLTLAPRPPPASPPTLTPSLASFLGKVLLASPHRTLDGASADFYYVPAYMSCAILPVYDWSGSPSYQQGFPMRPVTAMRMARYYAYLLHPPTAPTYCTCSTYSTLLRTCSAHSTTLPLYHSTTPPLYHSTTLPLYHSTTLPLYHSTHQAHAAMERVRSTLPYWNASKGRPGSDHIFLFSHDEGGCFAPQPVAEAAIILSHWGRLDPEPHASSRYQACLCTSLVCTRAHGHGVLLLGLVCT